MAERPDRETLAMFAFLVVAGGSNAVAVRLTNQELPPFWGASIRFAAAALLLAWGAVLLRVPRPRGQSLLGALLFGVFGIGLAYTFAYWALVSVPAGVLQVLLALVPLLTLFLALAHGLERFRWRALAGALLALAGVAVVFRDQLQGSVGLAPMLASLAAGFCMAEAGVLAKRFPTGHPVAANAVALVTGACMLLGLSVLFGEPRAPPGRAATWTALAYLVLVGSVAMFILYLQVLRRWTASGTSYQFVLVPFITVAVAAVVLGERLSAVFAVGGALVLLGVYVGALSGRHAAPEAEVPVTPPAPAPPPPAEPASEAPR